MTKREELQLELTEKDEELIQRLEDITDTFLDRIEISAKLKSMNTND